MWEQIRANKRKAFWLITGMGLILLLMGYFIAEAWQSGAGPFGMLVALAIFLIQLSVYALAGESVLMSGLGAREMAREESPRLFNIVEEMQIASGLGFTPRIYLVDTDAPNAFAVGRKPETSIVAVTRGLMYRLDRDELQGVIAHEIAHLKNLDTKFMTLAGVMLGSIIIMSDVASRMFFYGGRGRTRSDSRGDSKGGGQAQLIMLLVAVLLIIIGPILARLLYFSLSRTREYLADASAAVYTRYPEGLASALIKISGSVGIWGAQGVGDINRAVAPMFIINPLKADGGSDSVFATHPPMQDRVRVLRAMGGASFLDYDRAFQSVKKKRAHIIGKHTLGETTAQSIRAASDEGPADAGPLQTREESKAVVHAMYGYASIECQCGARLKVPSTYTEPTVRCIRCGAIHPAPEFPPPMPKLSEAERRRQASRAAAAGPLPVLDYTRKSHGVWEGFPCQCGTMIQLSPLFSAPSIECRKCGTQWRIH